MRGKLEVGDLHMLAPPGLRSVGHAIAQSSTRSSCFAAGGSKAGAGWRAAIRDNARDHALQPFFFGTSSTVWFDAARSVTLDKRKDNVSQGIASEIPNPILVGDLTSPDR